LLNIDAEFQALIPPLTAAEKLTLEENLVADGCREALTIWQGILLDGHNRLEICERREISYTTHAVNLVDRKAAKEWIIRNQFGRRNLQPFQRAELALKLKPLIEERAKANQMASPGRGKKGLLKSTNLNSIDTRLEVAKVAGVSPDTIRKAEKIAKQAPDAIKTKLRSGETTINREYKKIGQDERRAEQVAAIQLHKAPEGKFHVIVADPPWTYNKRANDATHRGANPYPSMSLEEIESLPIERFAFPDCILWLWTTNAFMVEAHQVAKRWGFQVKTILTWGKDRMGTGDWLRGQTEHCLMCVRGRPVVTLTNQTTLITGPLRQHSRKPDSFFEMVEKLCPGLKLELFGREDREGWTTNGAECGLFNKAS
jgi:N6-adenosine-specific RNA methylase IME4